MASNHAIVARTIRQFVDDNLTPEASARKFATAARGYRDQLIREGTAPAQYLTFVDGREGAKEETTRPGGATVYRFSLIGAIVRRVLTELERSAPQDRGDYMRSFVVAVNSRPWTQDFDDIPPDAEVMIVNVVPYARKIETGAITIRVPAKPFERSRQRLLRAFPSVFFGLTFVLLPGSFGRNGYETPYVLKGQYHDPQFSARRRERQFRRGLPFHRAGKSQTRGQQVTYPALTISLAR